MMAAIIMLWHKLKWHALIWARLLWFFVAIIPALVIYVATLGFIGLDIREAWNAPIVEIPGWSRNELTWFVSVPF